MQPARLTTNFSEKLSKETKALGMSKAVNIDENINRERFFSNFFFIS